MKKKKTIKRLLLRLLRQLLLGIRWVYRRCRTCYRFIKACIRLVKEEWRTALRFLKRSLFESFLRHRVAYSTSVLGFVALLIMVIVTAQPSDAGQEKITRIIYKVYPSTTDIYELEKDSVSRWANPLPDMPEPCIGMRVKRFPTSYHKMFNDSNYIHWADAEKIGIDPITDLRSYWNLRRPLVKIESCEDYYIEPLKYSRPYLVPEGAAMLHEIGKRFRDTLKARGGGDYRIKVTSLLRTPTGVARLRRRNRNAVDSSVHQLGTTVDISYSRFIADSDSIPRSQEDLKAVLAEVLLAMRSEGKCWVKHEHKQPCFHISARPIGSPRPKEIE